VSRVAGLAVVAVASMVVLSGCGSTPDLNPGVAARVGDDTVSVQHVADVAAGYCAAAEPQLQDQVLPNHYLNAQVASSIALRSAADQMMAEHDVTVDESYTKAEDAARNDDSLAKLSDSARDALIEVQGAQTYVNAAEISVGKDALGASATADDAQAFGAKVFLAWLADHDVKFDPKYGVAIVDGKSVIEDTSLSYALSDTATKADATTPDTTYAGALPDAQRCG
jgi:peptidyl-prolyl cis-trans isomerase SurA